MTGALSRATAATTAARGPHRRSGRVVRPITGLLPLVTLLAIWQAVGSDSSPYFPRPSTWWKAISDLRRADLLWPAVGHTALVVAVGLALATVLGGLLGLVLGMSPAGRAALNPTLTYVRLVPAPALIPAGILILGTTTTMAVTVITLTSCWPVLLNVTSGVAAMNPLVDDVATCLRLSRWQRAMHITVPTVTPNLLVGVRVAAPVAVVVALVVEMLTNTDGLGAQLIAAQRSFDAAGAYGLLVVVGVLGLVINFLAAACERAVLRRRGVSDHD